MFGRTLLPRTLEAAIRDISSTKVNIRVDAIREIVPHGDESRERVVRALEGALRDPAPPVRSAAAVALADLRANEALPSLLIALEDDDANVRQMAITALGEIGDPRATERLRRALSDKRAEIRFQAAIAFPRVCASRADALSALVAATHDPDPLVCHIALRMAEELGDDAPDPPAGNAATHSNEPGAGENDAGRRMHGSEEDDGRGVVHPELLARARALVDHESATVRIVAAILLARAGEDAGHAILAAVARGDLVSQDREDEAAAIELCGELGLETSRAGLERRAFGGLIRRDHFAWHARVALARMGHERAVREIVGELGARDRDRRTLAVAAVGRARIAVAREILEAMRGDEARADQGTVDGALAALLSDDEPSASSREAQGEMA